MSGLTSRYYPTLATIVDTDEIPDILGFVKDGVISVLGKIHYKDLQYSKSAKGDAAFYSLSIVTKKRLDFEIPGTGIFFVLNPDLGSGPDFNVSVFPITLSYEWKILAYLRGFDLSDFSFNTQEIFEVALKVLNISEEQAIAQFLNIFVEPDGEDTTVLEQYVTDINGAGLAGGLISEPTGDTTLRDISEEIYTKKGDFSSSAGFTTYIFVDGDLDETKAKLKRFFRSLLPNDIEEYVKDLLLPKISTSLELSAAIEFPRNILRPVYLSDGTNPFDDGDSGEAFSVIEGNEDDDPKVLMSFGEVLFTARTEDGFGYSMDLVLNTNVPAEIGSTGLIIDIEDVKVDLFENKNIPEADADGRPNEFKGVFIKNAAITFPNFFTPEDDNMSIIARNLLIGSEGGLSGTIGIQEAAEEDDSEPVYLNFVITDGIAGFSFNAGTKEITIVGDKPTFNEVIVEEEITYEEDTVEAESTFYIPPSGRTVIDSENNKYSISNTGVVTELDPLEGGLLQFTLFGTTITIDKFYLTFSKNKVVSSTVTGSIYFSEPDWISLKKISTCRRDLYNSLIVFAVQDI